MCCQKYRTLTCPEESIFCSSFPATWHVPSAWGNRGIKKCKNYISKQPRKETLRGASRRQAHGERGAKMHWVNENLWQPPKSRQRTASHLYISARENGPGDRQLWQEAQVGARQKQKQKVGVGLLQWRAQTPTTLTTTTTTTGVSW